MQQFDQAPVEADAIESSLATIVQGSTAPSAFSVGKYIYVKHNGTLDPGLYRVKSAIAQGDTLSSSNLEQDSEGVVNALNGKFAISNDNVASEMTVDDGCNRRHGRERCSVSCSYICKVRATCTSFISFLGRYYYRSKQ